MGNHEPTENNLFSIENMLMGSYGYLSNSTRNPMLNTIKTQIENGVKSKIKSTFGKEYYITRAQGYEQYIKTVILEKFISKYDKNFKKHCQKNGNSNNILLNDGIYLIELGNTKDTFMYIAAGMDSMSFKARFIMNSGGESSDMYIYIFGKKMLRYSKELEQIVADVYNAENLGIFTIDKSDNRRYGDDKDEGESLDIRYMPMEPRRLETLFFANNELDTIIHHIDRYIEQQESYKKHQLPYKTGILLYGSPGTGKTSIVRALATYYDRDIVNINVAHLMNIDLTRLSESITLDTYRKYIVLLEEIDCLYLNRDKEEKIDKEDNAVIGKLLNFIDGPTSPADVIFIATTNYKDRLDQALLRPGRIDLHVKICELPEKDVYRFARSFELPDDKIAEIIKEYPALLEEIGKTPSYDSVGNPLYTQSAIQGMILNKMEHKDRKIDIVDTSELLMKSMEAESNKRSDDEDDE